MKSLLIVLLSVYNNPEVWELSLFSRWGNCRYPPLTSYTSPIEVYSQTSPDTSLTIPCTFHPWSCSPPHSLYENFTFSLKSSLIFSRRIWFKKYRKTHKDVCLSIIANRVKNLRELSPIVETRHTSIYGTRVQWNIMQWVKTKIRIKCIYIYRLENDMHVIIPPHKNSCFHVHKNVECLQ